MIKVDDIIRNIDTSKKETEWVDLYEICSSEFEIHEFIQQPEDNIRLTYCYYHRWICTDTEVGIRVWYLDDESVCISWQPYRKSNETFGWLSKDGFDKVRNYVLSLKDDEMEFNVINDETINKVVEQFNSINHKEFEIKNVV